MGRGGSYNYRDLVALKNNLEKTIVELDYFCDVLTRELAARLLTKVIKRTPVRTGVLRRGWTAGKDVKIGEYTNSLSVRHVNGEYIITIVNPVHYGIYVEFGHRQEVGRYVPAIGKRLVNPWVKGQFMLTYSENELRSEAPDIIRKKLDKKLKEAFRWL